MAAGYTGARRYGLLNGLHFHVQHNLSSLAVGMFLRFFMLIDFCSVSECSESACMLFRLLALIK